MAMEKLMTPRGPVGGNSIGTFKCFAAATSLKITELFYSDEKFLVITPKNAR